MKNGFDEYMNTIELPSDDVILQTIQSVQQVSNSNYTVKNYINFLGNQLYFLKSTLWIAQIVTLLLGFVVSNMCMKNHMDVLLRFSVSFVPIILHMFSVPLLLKSLDHDVIELENVTYYRYAHVLMSRIILIGCINLVTIYIMSLLTLGISHLTFEQIMLYSLVPYNISCILCFVVMCFTQHKQYIIHSIISSSVFSIILFLISNTNLYAENTYMIVWRVMLIFSSLCLLVITFYVIKQAACYERTLQVERRVLWS